MTKKEAIRKAILQELARREFWEFCMYYDRDFFILRPFLKTVADAMQKIEYGDIKSLSVSMPPRAGKSYITSLYCAWTLGRNPKESVMRNTCTATLYQKFSYDVRNILISDKFKEVFPDVTLSRTKSNLQGWNTNQSKMVGYFGAGVGGTIIGFGATKVAITDDLYRGMEDALSDSVNDRTLQWKEATHDSRLEKGCARIDIGTRWTKNDVIGRSMENDDYDLSIVQKALDENDETFCEDVLSTEEYHRKREKMDEAIWLAEYQQEPIDLKGRLFSNLQTITEEEWKELKGRISGYIGYIDVADEGNDYTALAIGAIVHNYIYIVDVVYSKANTDVTIPLCASLLDKYGVKYCRVESNSMGAMFARSLQRHTGAKIMTINNSTNKNTRIIMQSSHIINKFIFVERKYKEYIRFIENLQSYSKEGKNKNDDAPDCISGLSLFVESMLPRLIKS